MLWRGESDVVFIALLVSWSHCRVLEGEASEPGVISRQVELAMKSFAQKLLFRVFV
jgi:hypothetical protein